MLAEHAKWCESGGAEGQPSVFDGVDLRALRSIRGYNLTALSARGAVFYGLDMEGVQLQGAHLEDADLRSANERLLQWQSAARRLDAENQTLRGMLNFQSAPESRYVTARVIGDTGGAFVHSVILNAGADAGVLRGQAAVTGVGLVGRVTHVGSRSARVLRRGNPCSGGAIC